MKPSFPGSPEATQRVVLMGSQTKSEIERPRVVMRLISSAFGGF